MSACKYGNPDSVKRDLNALNDIMARQGHSLLLDAIAETCGHSANRYQMSETERKRMVESLVNELKEAILERV